MVKQSIFELRKQELELLQEKKKLQEKLPHLYGNKHYKWSRQFFESRNKMLLLCSANQVGKALWDETPILTDYGFKLLKDLRVGDTIFGRDGRPTKVIAIPYIGEDDCYKFHFDFGEPIISSAEHLWFCKGGEERFRKSCTRYGKWQLKNTGEIFKNCGETPRPLKRYVLPIAEAIQQEEKVLFDPYLVGVLIGDGGLTCGVTLTTPEQEIVEYIHSKYEVTKRGPLGYYLLNLTEVIRGLGLFGKKSEAKFIPDEYFYGSVEQRLELLQGLMDTDGYIDNKGVVQYNTASIKLSEDITRLVSSLGGVSYTKIKKSGYKKDGVFKQCLDSYLVTIKMLINPFKLPRKANKFYKTRYAHERLIYEIEKVGNLPCRCITVDNEDGSFLAGRDLVVTHNSTVQIRKMIHWATEPKLWPSLWRTRPRQFWYLYPSREVASSEFLNKWETELMPRDEMKDDPQYGWKLIRKLGDPHCIEFNTGVVLYFKTYTQSVQHLQTGTVHYIGTDEELLIDLYDELMFRLSATDGYFSMAFTATIGQEFWYRALERKGMSDETLINAEKIQVSMYECLQYEDGSESLWNEKRISEIKAKCKSEAEILKRVYGRFVKAEGLKYPCFNRRNNLVAPYKIPPEWMVYSGVDVGSSGESSHRSAICFVAVRPDYRKGVVFRGWRSDRNKTYTAGDVLEMYRVLRGNLRPVLQCYDWGSKDFVTYASRLGESFTKAEKSHDIGENLINVLFKNKMLDIFDIEELSSLAVEFENLSVETQKRFSNDDFIDAMRYTITRIPWDYTGITSEYSEEDSKPKSKEGFIDKRRKFIFGDEFRQIEFERCESQIEAYNELLEY